MGRLGIIGGTGLLELEGLEVRRRREDRTRWGAPSGPVLEGVLGGREVASCTVTARRRGFRPTGSTTGRTSARSPPPVAIASWRWPRWAESAPISGRARWWSRTRSSTTRGDGRTPSSRRTSIRRCILTSAAPTTRHWRRRSRAPPPPPGLRSTPGYLRLHPGPEARERGGDRPPGARRLRLGGDDRNAGSGARARSGRRLCASRSRGERGRGPRARPDPDRGDGRRPRHRDDESAADRPRCRRVAVIGSLRPPRR